MKSGGNQVMLNSRIMLIVSVLTFSIFAFQNCGDVSFKSTAPVLVGGAVKSGDVDPGGTDTVVPDQEIPDSSTPEVPDDEHGKKCDQDDNHHDGENHQSSEEGEGRGDLRVCFAMAAHGNSQGNQGNGV